MFILLGKSLFKIGTGFNGTLKGYVYAVNPEFCKEKNGWIGFCGVSHLNFLFNRLLNWEIHLQKHYSPAERSILQEAIEAKQWNNVNR